MEYLGGKRGRIADDMHVLAAAFHFVFGLDLRIPFARSVQRTLSNRVVVATGGGSFKYFHLLQSRLPGIEIQRHDELETLIAGFNFCVASNRILNEVFSYDALRQQDAIKFVEVLEPITEENPVLIVNVGSGVSFLKVAGEEKYERVSGTSIGGGTLWGLLSLLSDAKTYEEMLGGFEGPSEGASLLYFVFI